MVRSQGRANTDRAAAAVARLLWQQAADTRRRELTEALSRLETRGDLTQEQRAVVRTLADRLSARLVAPALAAVLVGEADPETVAVLFEVPNEWLSESQQPD